MIWWSCGTGSKQDTGRQASPTSPATVVTYLSTSLLFPGGCWSTESRGFSHSVVTDDPHYLLPSSAAALEHQILVSPFAHWSSFTWPSQFLALHRSRLDLSLAHGLPLRKM